jgi:two-component system, OmpR family, phosphate regulon response regulator PhoB
MRGKGPVDSRRIDESIRLPPGYEANEFLASLLQPPRKDMLLLFRTTFKGGEVIMQPHRILVVEDDPSISELVSLTLSNAGHIVAAAADGVEALEKIRREKPDLVVLDILIPEPDGWKLYTIIRNDPALAHVRILILTALITKQDPVYKRNILPEDGYMTKPFNLDELRMKVLQLMKNQTTHQYNDLSCYNTL